MGRLARRSGGVRTLLERVWGIDAERAAIELVYVTVVGQLNNSASATDRTPYLPYGCSMGVVLSPNGSSLTSLVES